MLKLHLKELEYFDDSKQEFVTLPALDLELEHSLVSISKWESKWKKPFLSESSRTDQETIDYIGHMANTAIPPEEIYPRLSESDVEKIATYINEEQTATWFYDPSKGKPQKKKPSETITSELIYYWIISLAIPTECQYWHLSRLLTLIRVCNEKNNPKKLSRAEIAERNRALNEKRKAEMNTRG